MSNTDGTCEYVLDPEDPETWGGEEGDECYVDEEVLNEDGVWTCPHDVEKNEDFCIFHLDINKKKADNVVEEFIDEIQNGEETQFLAGKFKSFDVSGRILETDKIIRLSYMKVTDGIDWSDSIFELPSMQLRGIESDGGGNFRGGEFRGEINFSHSTFAGEYEFGAKFREFTSFEDCTFETSNFVGAEFEKAATFQRAEFTWGHFAAEFQRNVSFNDATFHKSLFFPVYFGESAIFGNTTFRGDAVFDDIEFVGDAYFKGASFGADVEFAEINFNSGICFNDIEVRGSADFRDVEFIEDPIFEGLNLQNSRFDGCDLTEATFTGANLSNANLESALLSRATLFDSDLRGAKLGGAILGDVRINDETKFLGHSDDNSNTSSHTLSAIRSQPCCVYDPAYEDENEHADVDKAKSVYRALEELGGKHARPRLQARSFVRRQDLQKKDYWDDATADDASFEERFIAGARWSRARVARAIMLYGESPWRIISWSLGIVLSLALLYPLGRWMKPTDGEPITYAQITSNPVEILNSVYYSTLTFTALGFGDFKPVGFGRVLTTIETALGAVLIALLVFVLGRRAAR